MLNDIAINLKKLNQLYVEKKNHEYISQMIDSTKEIKNRFSKTFIGNKVTCDISIGRKLSEVSLLFLKDGDIVTTMNFSCKPKNLDKVIKFANEHDSFFEDIIKLNSSSISDEDYKDYHVELERIEDYPYCNPIFIISPEINHDNPFKVILRTFD